MKRTETQKKDAQREIMISLLIDPVLFREQRRLFRSVAALDCFDYETKDALEGIENLLDFIADEASDAGMDCTPRY